MKLVAKRQRHKRVYLLCTSKWINSSCALINILAKNPYFSPPPSPPFNSGTLISSIFFFFFEGGRGGFQKKYVIVITNVIIFHLRFCWILSVGWGIWFFVKKLEKGELNVKHFWCGMGWRVFNLGVTLTIHASVHFVHFNDMKINRWFLRISLRYDLLKFENNHF